MPTLPRYRLHLKDGVDSPEDGWGRILVFYATPGAGLRILEEYTRDCIIECGPITRNTIAEHLYHVLDIFDDSPTEKFVPQMDEDEIW